MSSKHINFIFNINHASNGPTSIEINNNQIGFQIGFQKKNRKGAPPPLSIFFSATHFIRNGYTHSSGENVKFGRLGIFGDHPLSRGWSTQLNCENLLY